MEVLTVSEAAEFLRLQPRTIERLSRERQIPAATKIGSNWRFKFEGLECLLTMDDDCGYYEVADVINKVFETVSISSYLKNRGIEVDGGEFGMYLVDLESGAIEVDGDDVYFPLVEDDDDLPGLIFIWHGASKE